MKILPIYIILFYFTLSLVKGQGKVTINSDNNNTEIPARLREIKTEIKTFIDTRDSKSYKCGKIGNQVWMLENINFNYPGSLSYNDSTNISDKYGRLYSFEMAKSVCHKGWHLPSKEEWSELIEFSGGDDIAGKVLKSDKGWDKSDKIGLNILNFSAYPGGILIGENTPGSGGADNHYSSLGGGGYFWGSTKTRTQGWSYTVSFFYNGDFTYQSGASRDSYLSVRCIKD